jgi:hypothetical protein
VLSDVGHGRTTSLGTTLYWFVTHIFTGDFNFKVLTARRPYKAFGVKGLKDTELQFSLLFQRSVYKCETWSAT